MRLWTLHPRYLDTSGLVACWREALLAQQVLTGKTKGYRYHPQLRRFCRTDDPVSAIRLYLRALLQEADRRAFRFDPSRIGTPIIFTPHFPRQPVNWNSKETICSENWKNGRLHWLPN